MKKIVLKIANEDETGKRRMLKTIAATQGVESISVDMKEKKVTVIGDTDPVYLMSKLRKFSHIELFSVGPAKEVKVGFAKEEKPEGEKSHSEKTKISSAPEIVCVPHKYRPFEYTAVNDENPKSCGIS